MFFFVALLMPVIVAATYFVNYYLIPTYLLRDKYFSFGVYFIYTLIAAVFLESAIAIATYILVAGLKIQDISPAAINIRFVLAALLMIIFLGVAIKMRSHWRQSREQYNLLLKERVEAELRFLKTQLNPHFLFNTLNNLYYLSIEKSDLVPKAILALSELLDYILAGTHAEYVPLEREINLIRNYIELEQLRFGDRVSVQLNVTDKPIQIAPMLLFTLVENAFKHGAGKSNGQHFINIIVQDSDNQLLLCVENTIQASNDVLRDGIGLQNLRLQLALLYPGQHQLIVSRQTDRFVVNLKIRL
jgi:LytS/YehU family sensor histidine kinase